MSGLISVVVLCLNGRRETVRVTPNSSILQVLEEACKKQKINPLDFDLRHYNRTLDLSLPIRFANLPNNALVELRPATKPRADCIVTVALQLESGERITKDFSPSASVFEVLEQCLKSKSICMQEIGEPVCIYMRQKIMGDAIKSTTLRSLGLTNGKAIIRLLYREPEALDGQAHVTSPLTAPSAELGAVNSFNKKPADSPVQEQVKKQARLEDSVPEQRSLINETVAKPNDLVIEHSDAMDVDEIESFSKDDMPHASAKRNENTSFHGEENSHGAENIEVYSIDENVESCFADQQSNISCDSELQDEEIGEINYIGDRHAVIYSLDDITDVKKADLPDEFFDLTVNDAKYLMDTYRKERVELENQPLLTKDQRQRQILQKLAQYSQTVIRIYFPERLVLQAVFTSTETVQTVQEFIQNYLEDNSLNFYLYITPPKEKLNPTKTLLEAMLVPAAVMYFGSDIQRTNYLTRNLREKKSDPRAAALAASESRKGNISNTSLILPEENVSNIAIEAKVDNVSTTTTPYQPPNQSQGKVPKWLKLNKK